MAGEYLIQVRTDIDRSGIAAFTNEVSAAMDKILAKATSSQGRLQGPALQEAITETQTRAQASVVASQQSGTLNTEAASALRSELRRVFDELGTQLRSVLQNAREAEGGVGARAAAANAGVRVEPQAIIEPAARQLAREELTRPAGVVPETAVSNELAVAEQRLTQAREASLAATKRREVASLATDRAEGGLEPQTDLKALDAQVKSDIQNIRQAAGDQAKTLRTQMQEQFFPEGRPAIPPNAAGRTGGEYDAYNALLERDRGAAGALRSGLAGPGTPRPTIGLNIDEFAQHALGGKYADAGGQSLDKVLGEFEKIYGQYRDLMALARGGTGPGSRPSGVPTQPGDDPYHDELLRSLYRGDQRPETVARVAENVPAEYLPQRQPNTAEYEKKLQAEAQAAEVEERAKKELADAERQHAAAERAAQQAASQPGQSAKPAGEAAALDEVLKQEAAQRAEAIKDKQAEATATRKLLAADDSYITAQVEEVRAREQEKASIQSKLASDAEYIRAQVEATSARLQESASVQAKLAGDPEYLAAIREEATARQHLAAAHYVEESKSQEFIQSSVLLAAAQNVRAAKTSAAQATDDTYLRSTVAAATAKQQLAARVSLEQAANDAYIRSNTQAAAAKQLLSARLTEEQAASAAFIRSSTTAAAAKQTLAAALAEEQATSTRFIQASTRAATAKEALGARLTEEQAASAAYVQATTRTATAREQLAARQAEDRAATDAFIQASTRAATGRQQLAARQAEDQAASQAFIQATTRAAAARSALSARETEEQVASAAYVQANVRGATAKQNLGARIAEEEASSTAYVQASTRGATAKQNLNARLAEEQASSQAFVQASTRAATAKAALTAAASEERAGNQEYLQATTRAAASRASLQAEETRAKAESTAYVEATAAATRAKNELAAAEAREARSGQNLAAAVEARVQQERTQRATQLGVQRATTQDDTRQQAEVALGNELQRAGAQIARGEEIQRLLEQEQIDYVAVMGEAKAAREAEAAAVRRSTEEQKGQGNYVYDTAAANEAAATTKRRVEVEQARLRLAENDVTIGAQVADAEIVARAAVLKRAQAEEQRVRELLVELGYGQEQLSESEGIAGLMAQRKRLESELNAKITKINGEASAQGGAGGQGSTGGFFQRISAYIRTQTTGQKQDPAEQLGIGQLITQGLFRSVGFAASGLGLYQAVGTIKAITQEAERTQVVFNQIRAEFDALGQNDQFPKFRDEILAMARASGIAADQVGQIGLIMKGAFTDTATALEATNQGLAAMQVAGLSVQEVRNLFVALPESFGLTRQGIGGINDELLHLQDTFGVAVREIAEGVGNIAPLASSLGLSFKETSTIVAAAAAASGRSAQTVANEIGRALTQIEKQGPAVAQVFTAIPGEAAKVNDLLATGQSGQVLVETFRNWDKLSQSQKNNFAQLIGGRREAASLAAALGESSRIVHELDDNSSHAGRTQSALAEYHKTLSFQVNAAKEALRQLGEALLRSGLGTFLTDVVHAGGDAAQVLAFLARQFATLNDATGGFVGRLIEVVVAFKLISALANSGILSKLPGAGTLSKIPGVGGVFNPKEAEGATDAAKVGESITAAHAEGAATVSEAIVAAHTEGAAAVRAAMAAGGIATAEEMTTAEEAWLAQLGAAFETFDAQVQAAMAAGGAEAAAEIKAAMLSGAAGGAGEAAAAGAGGGAGAAAAAGGVAGTAAARASALDVLAAYAAVHYGQQGGTALSNSDLPVIGAPNYQDVKLKGRQAGGFAGFFTHTELTKQTKAALDKQYDEAFQALSDEQLKTVADSAKSGGRFGENPVKTKAKNEKIDEARKAIGQRLRDAPGNVDANKQNLQAMLDAGDITDDQYNKLADGIAKGDYGSFKEVSALYRKYNNTKHPKFKAALDKVKGDAQKAAADAATQGTDKYATAQELEKAYQAGDITYDQAIQFEKARIQALKDTLARTGQLSPEQQTELDTLQTDLGKNQSDMAKAQADSRKIQAQERYDPVAAAQADVDSAQAQLDVAQGDLAKQQAANQLEQSKFALQQAKFQADEQRRQGELALAHAKINAAGGDPVANAKADLAAAQAELKANPDPAKDAQLRAQVTEANTAAANATNAQNQALLGYQKALDEGDPVKVAQDGVQAAKAAITAAGNNTTAWAAAEAQLVAAQRDVSRAQLAMFEAQMDVNKAIAQASGDTVGVAKIQLQEAQAELADAVNRQNQQDILKAQANVITAQAGVVSTQVQTSERDIDFALQMGQITTAQAIAQLTGLLTLVQGNTEQTQQILLKIKQLQSQGDIQFDLPSVFGLPTLYEARRLAQSGGPGGYQNNSQVSITYYAYNQTDHEQNVNDLAAVVAGPAATGTYTKRY